MKSFFVEFLQIQERDEISSVFNKRRGRSKICVGGYFSKRISVPVRFFITLKGI